MGGTASRGEKSSSSSSSSASASASSPPAPRSSSLRVKPLSSSLQRCLPFVCLCPNGVCTKPKNIRRDTASSSSPLHQPRYVSAGRAGDETGAVLVVGVDHTPAADLNAALTQRKRLKGNFKKKYILGKILGSGAFGQVRECANKQTKEVFAVKIISRRARERGPWSSSEMFRREVMLLSALSHPNIIRLIDAFEDRHHLYYVMEKCDGGELFEHIVRRKHFDEHEASRLCRQMLSALEYLHSFDIVHRDIKAENFLFRGKNVASSLVLIDFGMSARVLPDQSLTEVCGSPHYLSPELLRRQYSCPADMWALGVLVFLMLYGRYPYDGHTTGRIVRDILYKPVDFRSSHVRPSSLALSFIRSLLEPDPRKRLTASQALKHRWILEGDDEAKKEKEEAEIPLEILRSAHRKVTAGRLNTTKRGRTQEEEKRSTPLGHHRHSHLHHPRTMIADGILGGEPKTPTTRTLEWLSSSHQEIDPPQNTSVMTEEGDGGEERERRRHRRERRAPQRYWYRGGWQRKPRRPPEFSRQNKRLSTTPSTLQPRQRAELAELIREVSLALANGRSSSLGPSSIDIQDPVTSLDTDRLSESGGETSLMRQSQECVAHRRSSSTSFDREKEGGVHTDAFHNYEDSEYTSPIVGDERTSPPTAPRVVLLHRRSHRRPRKEFRPSPRIPENTQLRISSPDERKTSWR